MFQEAYDLDNPIAAWKLYNYYHLQYPDQKEKLMEILRQVEMLGNLKCIENLAELVIRSCGPNKSYYYKEVTRLVTKAAILGGDTRNLMICYQNKHIYRKMTSLPPSGLIKLQMMN